MSFKVNYPDDVWHKMSEEEKDHHFLLYFYGTYITSTNTIMMGAAGGEAIKNYRDEMIKKYRTDEDH